MKPFNKEQLDILAKWEESFFTATVSKYYRNISSKSLDTIKGVYDEAADKPYSANWSCNTASLPSSRRSARSTSKTSTLSRRRLLNWSRLSTR